MAENAVIQANSQSGDDTMKALLAGGILGGIVLFIWGGISWVMIPWHAKTFNDFTNEAQVTQVITSSARTSGIYTLPGMSHYKNTPEKDHFNTEMKGPLVFAAIHLENSPTMKIALLKEFIIDLLAAVLVTWLVIQAKGSSYLRRVIFVTLFGLAAGVASYLPLWNWFSFSRIFTSVAMADLVIGWFLAGLVIALVTRKATH